MSISCLCASGVKIQSAIYPFICDCIAQNALLFKILSIFLKMCSPPSVGSIILKAASVKNHEKRPTRTPISGEKSHFGAT